MSTAQQPDRRDRRRHVGDVGLSRHGLGLHRLQAIGCRAEPRDARSRPKGLQNPTSIRYCTELDSTKDATAFASPPPRWRHTYGTPAGQRLERGGPTIIMLASSRRPPRAIGHVSVPTRQDRLPQPLIHSHSRVHLVSHLCLHLLARRLLVLLALALVVEPAHHRRRRTKS